MLMSQRFEDKEKSHNTSLINYINISSLMPFLSRGISSNNHIHVNIGYPIASIDASSIATDDDD